jgi:heat shock protein HtpX
MAPRIDFFEQQRRNRRFTMLLIAGFIAVLGVLGLGLDLSYLQASFPWLTLAALSFGGLDSCVSFYLGDKMVLASVGARTPNPAALKEQQLQNVVQEMSLASGIPVPKVYIIHEASPNAFATGRDAAHASVAVTTGLLETMNREELQGVIAHEIGHIRNRDILTMTIVAALLGAIVLLSDVGRRIMFYGGSRGGRKKDSGAAVIMVIVLILMVLAPIIARLMALAVSRSREYMADAASAEFTRNPVALASALEKISTHYDQVVDKASQGTAHLFISDPMNKAVNNKEGKMASWLGTHPPIQNRIRILKQMAGVYAETPQA